MSSDPESPNVRVLAGFGGCSSFVRTNVQERSKAVGVEVVVHTTGVDCKAVLYTKVVDVVLAAPLGNRHVDGECAGPDDTICASLHEMADSYDAASG